jgi:hypothetical protein
MSQMPLRSTSAVNTTTSRSINVATQQILSPLTEDQFNSNFPKFLIYENINLKGEHFVIEGRWINLWALHKEVFSRNGSFAVSIKIIPFPAPSPQIFSSYPRLKYQARFQLTINGPSLAQL